MNCENCKLPVYCIYFFYILFKLDFFFSKSDRIKELTLQLNEVQRNREQLEKLIYNLTEELRTLRMKVDNQTMELSGTVSDLKLRARRLEEENKIQVHFRTGIFVP